MIFSKLEFLYYFLPIVLILYYAVPTRLKNLRNLILLLSSLFFYFYGEQTLIWAMLLSSVIDYLCSLAIERSRKHKFKHLTKVFLLISLTTNLSLLAYFKYSDFFIENFNALLGTSIPLLKMALPIGISLYTFQTMSYTIDVYMGNTAAQKNPLTFTTYVSLFPQLVAGPIVRYSDVEAELNHRKHSFEDFSYGVRRFIIGLSKKVLIANNFEALGQTISYSDEQTVLFSWMYAIAFMLQIYFDFSGYSDMAIGLGRIFGFKFPENFNYPYTAKSITDFWRRWHISLSSWFRDYVYIPLGGNRVSTFKWVRNIFIVWFLTGFWHGAEWNFILWGLFFAVFLLFEKFLLTKIFSRIPSIFPRIYTLLVVLFGFVLFNANNLSEVITNTLSMLGFSETPISLLGSETLYYLKSYWFLFLISFISATPLAANTIKKICHSGNCKGTKIINILEPAFLLIMLLWSTGSLVDGSFNPFLYFRF